ncbi:MAG TPA: hypothetical protein VMR49_02320 [Candidatus Paceibacterota bacterium]|nr:hypothetical protein [Candidatus Paceibacterota bacterium]
MENFNLIKKEDPKKESILDKESKVSNLAKIRTLIKNTPNFKATLLSKLLDNSKMDKTLADNLSANRILEEELIAPNESYSGFTPSLPEGAKIIDVYGSQYLQKDGRMYHIRKFKGGFDLVDSTYDFMPRPDELYPSKRKLKYQKKYNVSDASTPINNDQFYKFNETEDNLDNWIIHNDMGKIRKNDKSGKDSTWWQKGEPYKGMVKRSLLDQPEGRHLFAKQSALEASIGKPLDQHSELIGDVIEKGNVENGGITITPTSEASLPNIEGLKSFTYNPITKSMERGIFHNPKTPKNKDKKENYKHHGWDYNNPEK